MQPGQKTVKSIIKKKDDSNTVFYDLCQIPIKKCLSTNIVKSAKDINPYLHLLSFTQPG